MNVFTRHFSRFFFLVACSVLSAYGQQMFYVRAGASGSGADWNSAFGSLPATLVRGATYYVADGSYSSYTFDDPESGTAMITIRKATASDHGTESGWNNTYGDGQASFNGTLIFARDYYLVDGQTRDESDWLSVPSYGFHVGGIYSSGLAMPPGGDHITVRYCDIGSPYSQTTVTTDEAVYLGGFAETILDITVSRCFLHNSSFIQAAGVDGITVEYTAFAAGWAKEAFRGQIRCRNGIIRHCLFYNSSQLNPGEAGSGCTAEIAIWDGGSGAFDNWEIYGNVIWNDKIIHHSGGVIVVGGNGSSWAGSPANNVKVYNNTFVNIVPSGGGLSQVLINGPNGRIFNNLWYNCGATGASASAIGNNVVITANPFENSAIGNFKLTSASQARNVGVDLGAPYNTDRNGAIRGADGSWDVGAFEFTASGPDTTAPTITGIISSGITTSGATIVWTTDESSNSRVEYGTTTGYGSGINDASMVTAHSLVLSGLSAGVLYHYRVISTDSANNTRTSTDFTFTTSVVSDTVPPMISGITASSVSAAGATVLWITDEISNSRVEYGTTTSYGSEVSNASLLTAHSLVLSSLSPNTLYHYRVISTDGAGNTRTSADFTFTTMTGTPGLTFFVRGGALGSNNGSDWNNAYTSLPASLVRGATYYFADGNYSGYTFDDPVSGSQVITIKKAIVSDHGSDIGWQDAYGDGTAVFAPGIQFQSSYYVLDGQTRGEDWRSGYGFQVNGSSGSESRIVLIGVPFSTSYRDITLRYTEIRGTGRQDDSVNDRGIQVSLNSSNFTVSSCWLHDFDETPLMMHRVSNVLVEYSIIERNDSSPAFHSEGVVASEGVNNFTFRHNIMSDIEGTAFIATPVGGHPGCAGTIQRDWFVYGNVFVKPQTPLRATTGAGVLYIFDAQHQGELDFYNNSIINVDSGFVGFEAADSSGGCGVKMRVMNNVWFNTTFAVQRTSKVTDLIWSHNSYFAAVSTSDPDSNKQTGTGNPFVNWPNGDFRLMAATAAGAALAASYSVDAAGNVRGADGIWDRGAYELGGGGGTDTTAPVISGVIASSITTTSASIGWATDENSNSRVEYGTTASYGSVVNDPSMVTAHSLNLSGLSAGILYHYRVVSTDSASNTRTSADFTFTTAPTGSDVTPPTISGIAVGGITSSGATVTWTTDEISTRVVEYGSTTNYGSTASATGSATGHSVPLSGLAGNSLYHYRVRSTDLSGNVRFSSDDVLKTVPAPAILGIGVRVAVATSPSLRVRSTSALAGAVLGEQPLGALGTITAGPVMADGFTWWQIDYDVAPDGWSIEGSGWLVLAPPRSPTNLQILP